MKAIKFYDKAGLGFEIWLDRTKQSIMMEVDSQHDPMYNTVLELDEQDLDDIIIALTDLKRGLSEHMRETHN